MCKLYKCIKKLDSSILASSLVVLLKKAHDLAGSRLYKTLVQLR